MSGEWVMVCRGDALGGHPELDGCYLSHFDPDYRPAGDVRWSPELNLAVRFDSVVDVLQAWRMQSGTVPYRRDGRPNRPLTAWSIEPRRVEDAPDLAPPA